MPNAAAYDTTRTDWTSPKYADIPAEARPRITAYLNDVGGIPDCFDSLDVNSLRGHASDVIAGSDDPVATEIDRFVRGYFEMLGDWHDCIDHLDSDLRGDTVSGGIPEWAQQFLRLEAQGLFAATTDLLRAVAKYHHGAAGPHLSEDYGFAYELSNSVVSPFH